jgi:hypothetical protein
MAPSAVAASMAISVSGKLGRKAGNPVALADTGRNQELLEAGDLGIELGATHPPLDLVLAPENQRFAIIAPLQQVFGVIQPRLGKPAGAGHFVAIAQHHIAFFAHRTAEIPNFRPEIGGLID